MIDAATLTGAIVIGLGHTAMGVFANDDALAAEVLTAGRRASEPGWQLPMWDDYKDLIKSDVADIKNTGGRWGGSISAAQFLQRFVKEGTPWAHLDIAGTAMSSVDSEINRSWGSGFDVRLLDQLVRDHYEKP